MYLAFVVFAWAVSPLVKRRMLDYMSLPDGSPGDPSPVRTFVALFSFGCTLASAAWAWPTSPSTFMRRIPAEGWALITFGVALGTLASVFLVHLLASGNPGLTMVHLNAGTSVLTYVLGALLYGKLSWDSTAGVLMIAAGVALTAND